MSQTAKIWPLIGGIHPEQKKELSNKSKIQTLQSPPEVILPLNHANGAVAVPLVKTGDKVVKGQQIAQFNIAVSTRIHASVSGTIKSIEPADIAHSSGLKALCVTIESDNSNNEFRYSELSDWQNVPAAELVDRIEECGICGLGGAGFPTQIKYHSQSSIQTLIVNGVECEPYITADDVLMREHATEIVEGIQIGLKMLSAKNAIVAIEDNKPEAIAAVRLAITETSSKAIDVRVIPTKYPSGGEKQLIQILTGKEVPSGNIPASLGFLVQNVGTLYAIQQSVVLGIPLTERVITLTGEALSSQGNYRVPIGTPIRFLLDQTGLTPGNGHRIIMGGPMMGFEVPDSSAPIGKITNCLLIPTINELPEKPDAMSCIRCGKCEQVCPASLLPQQLYWNAANREWDKAELNSLYDCIECGACAYVCPSSIPLVQYYRFAKSEIKREHLEKVRADQSRQRFEDRQARLEKEAAEKDAKRKARAEAAAKSQSAKSDPDKSNLNDKAKADILASIARVKAKKSGKTSSSVLKDPETLKADMEKAEQVVLKAKEKLAVAKAADLPSVTALTTALGKLEQRALKARTDWQNSIEDKSKSE